MEILIRGFGEVKIILEKVVPTPMVKNKPVILIAVILIYIAFAVSVYELKSLPKETAMVSTNQTSEDGPLVCNLSSQTEKTVNGSLGLFIDAKEISDNPCLFVGCSGFF